MARTRFDNTTSPSPTRELEQLFLCLAEGLKLPLAQVSRRAELALLAPEATEALGMIQTTADMALQLLDSYLLGLRLLHEPEARFALEPVSVAAVLHDAQQQLAGIAQQYNVQLELEVAGKYGPVLAHPGALRSALVSLGYSFIEALPAMNTARTRLHLAAHRTRSGVVAGLYCDAEELTPKSFRRARDLLGYARQPFVGVLPGSGAGVFVANAIMQAMSSHLRVGRYQKLPGFAITLPPSSQLQLV